MLRKYQMALVNWMSSLNTVVKTISTAVVSEVAEEIPVTDQTLKVCLKVRREGSLLLAAQDHRKTSKLIH